MQENIEEDPNLSVYLQPPTHVVDEDCFVFPLPLMLKGKYFVLC